MGLNPVNLRNTAWIISLIFAVLGVLLILSMFAFSAPPWTLEDILMTFVLGGMYVSGLLIGKKWPLIGGVMSLILPIVGVIITIYALFRLEAGSGVMSYVGSSMVMYLIMMIPGFLYLLSWYLQRKIDQNDSMGEGV